MASLKLANVQKSIAVVQYEQAIQSAFREVADALAGRGTLDDQIAADQALVDASGESYRLSEMRFRSGIDNFLSVLDSQRVPYRTDETRPAQIKTASGSPLAGAARKHAGQASAARSLLDPQRHARQDQCRDTVYICLRGLQAPRFTEFPQ